MQKQQEYCWSNQVQVQLKWVKNSWALAVADRLKWSHGQHSLSTITGSFHGKGCYGCVDSLTTSNCCRAYPWTDAMKASRSLYQTTYMHLRCYFSIVVALLYLLQSFMTYLTELLWTASTLLMTKRMVAFIVHSFFEYHLKWK